MIYDYDLVVIGDSPEAEFAAERAGRLRSRVAWVTQVPADKTNDPDQGGNPALRAEVMLEVLRRGVAHLQPGETVADPQALWEKARSYAAIAVAEREPQRLQQVGVDVIEGLGRFETKLRLQLNVEGHLGLRELRSRNYLLAPSPASVVPFGLAQLSVDTAYSWPDWKTLPEHLTLLNPSPDGLILAQLLAQLGCHVSLVYSSHQLLPEWVEPEFAKLIEAMLIAAGVVLYRGSYDESELLRLNLNQQSSSQRSESPSEAKGKGWAIAIETAEGQQLWQSERLLIAKWRGPNWQGLNLSDVGLSLGAAEDTEAHHRTPAPITADKHLRTKHRQIYVCGAACNISGGRDAKAKHQAEMALRNALWWPWWRPQNGLGRNLTTLAVSPVLVQVGYGELQAQHRYPNQVTVVRCHAADHAASQWRDQTVGLCKLVVHCNGRLLGAHALATGAEDWMAIAAQVIQQKGSVKDLEKLALPRNSAASLLHQAAAQWRWDRLSETPRREDLIERFFNWRRTGSV